MRQRWERAEAAGRALQKRSGGMATVEMPIAEGCLGDELRSDETVKTQRNATNWQHNFII